MSFSTIATLLFMLAATASSVAPTPPPCESHKASRQSYFTFNFQNNTAQSTLHAQLVQYDNGLFGHYVSHANSESSLYYVNGSLSAMQYTTTTCESVSYKPKPFSRVWVKTYTGNGPFDWEEGQTESIVTGSVTLRCQPTYCSFYDFASGYSFPCYNTTNTTASNPSALQVKFNVTLYANNTNHYSAYSCSSVYGYSNSTASCAYPSTFSYYSSHVPLTLSLNTIKITPRNATTPTYIPSQNTTNIQSSYGSYTENMQYFSVCGEGCTLIPVTP